MKNPSAMWETWAPSLGQEDPLGGGHGNPLQYSGLENPMDCIVHMDTTEHGTQHIPTIYKADNKDLQYSPGNYPRYPVTPSCGESEKEGIYM